MQRASTTATCNGCFELLHPGHLFYLGYCTAQGDRLVIGLNSDAYIRRKKNRSPCVNEGQRREILLDLGIASSVIVFEENDPSEFLRIVRPDIHCIGEEYRGVAPELEVCQDIGIRVAYVPRIGSWSTTRMLT